MNLTITESAKYKITDILAEENRKKWDSYQPIEVVESITGGNYVQCKSVRSL